MKVASLLAFRGADALHPASAPKRSFDATLALLLAAAAALALAAAEPRLASRRADAYYVVLDGSVSMTSRTCDAVARAQSLLAEAAPAAVRADHPLLPSGTGRADDGLPGSLEPHLDAARVRGFPGIVLVTDAAVEPMPGVAVIGPSEAASRNVAVSSVSLDGADAVVSLRNFSDREAEVTLRGGGGDRAVTVAARAIAVVRVPAPEPGMRARYAIAGSRDDLAADDVLEVERLGGIRRVRFERDVPCPRTEGALRASGALAVPGEDPEAVVRYAMPWAETGARPTLVIAPRPSEPNGEGAGLRLVAAGNDTLRGDVLVGGEGAVVLPSPGTTLVAPLRVAGAVGATWSDASGAVAVALPGLVVLTADPEDPRSDWHRDPSFPAWIASALDRLAGGPDRLVPMSPVPVAESDVVHPLPVTSSPERLREMVRHGEADEDPVPLGAWSAGAAGAMIAAACLLRTRRG